MADYSGPSGNAARDFEIGLIKRGFASDSKARASLIELTLRKGR